MAYLKLTAAGRVPVRLLQAWPKRGLQMAATMGQGLPEATCLPLARVSFPGWEGLGRLLSQEVLTSRLEDLEPIVSSMVA